MAALAAGYALQARGEATSLSRRHVACFCTSMVVLVVALLSPLDPISDDYLFSAHMVQHLLLALVWPPLLLMSFPTQALMKFSLLRQPPLSPVVFACVAFVVFNVDISVWHLPALYDLTLRNEGVHIVEHLTFMAAGLLLWLPIAGPLPGLRLVPALQTLYLFANLFPGMALGILFTFLRHALYSPYVEAPRLWGVSPVSDQQAGGLIMWMPGSIPLLVALAVVVIRWLDQAEPTSSLPVGSQGLAAR